MRLGLKPRARFGGRKKLISPTPEGAHGMSPNPSCGLSARPSSFSRHQKLALYIVCEAGLPLAPALPNARDPLRLAYFRCTFSQPMKLLATEKANWFWRDKGEGNKSEKMILGPCWLWFSNFHHNHLHSLIGINFKVLCKALKYLAALAEEWRLKASEQIARKGEACSGCYLSWPAMLAAFQTPCLDQDLNLSVTCFWIAGRSS